MQKKIRQKSQTFVCSVCGYGEWVLTPFDFARCPKCGGTMYRT